MRTAKIFGAVFGAMFFLSGYSGCQSFGSEETQGTTNQVSALCKEWVGPWRWTGRVRFQDCKDDLGRCVCGRSCNNPKQMFFATPRSCDPQDYCQAVCDRQE